MNTVVLYMFVLLPFFIINVLAENSDEVVEVDTDVGRIHGTRIIQGGRSVDVFRGIPYAKPPIGKLRFRKTEPVEPWDETLMATEFRPACPQPKPTTLYPWSDDLPGQSEDCLYLNIWKLSNQSSCPKGRPVMFFIHSGGFKHGSSRKPIYDGRVIAGRGNVVVVTFNHRLGILGFSDSGTEAAPGNAGLYDILEALKWVNANIDAFGGNRKRITVFGQDAGAVGVGIMSISPLFRGLYRRAIMESGSPAYFFTGSQSENVELTDNIAKSVNCTTDSKSLYTHPHEVMDCLRELDFSTLLNKPYYADFKGILTVRPTHGEALLPERPIDLLAKGDFHGTDLLIGITKDEGSVNLVQRFPQIFGGTGEKDPEINKTRAEDMLRQVFGNISNYRDILKYYLGPVGNNNYTEIRRQLYTAIGDYIVKCPALYFAEKFADADNGVYFYHFTHRPSISPWASWMGIPHFADVQFVFGQPLMHPRKYQSNEVTFSKRVIKRWTHFAKTGYPGGEWPQFTTENPRTRILNPDMKLNGRANYRTNCELFRTYFGF